MHFVINFRLIRLSSPNLNYLIVIGAIVLYVDVYLYVIPTESESSAVAICHVRQLYIIYIYNIIH